MEHCLAKLNIKFQKEIELVSDPYIFSLPTLSEGKQLSSLWLPHAYLFSEFQNGYLWSVALTTSAGRGLVGRRPGDYAVGKGVP